MPIYAYKCESCGFAKDVLQKISDPVLSDCPSCAAPAFKKQLTAAGFQLKGSGWYVTDFREGSSQPKKADPSADAAASPAGTPSTPAAGAAPAATANPAAPAPAAAATSAGAGAASPN